MMAHVIRGVTAAILSSLLTAAPALSADEPPRCADDPAFHELDFWLGDWVVRVGGREVGRNRIESILDGCAVAEHWRAADGKAGESLFYRHDGTWKQVWVTASALARGGVKEKSLVEKGTDGSLLFVGRVPLPGGGSYGDRTRLVPQPDGTVRQVIEVARSGGDWTSVFDAIYSRR